METSVSRIKFLAFASALFLCLPLLAGAQDDRPIKCTGCHKKVEVTSTAHADVDCQSCHSNVTSRRHRAEDLADLSGDAICAQCHRITSRALDRSVHAGNAGCLDCHGAAHDIKGVDESDSAVTAIHQIQTCGGCHRSQEGLIEGYLGSVHGHGLLDSGLVSAPACSDCHGDHRILPVHDEKAPTSHTHSPEMCGDCHAGVLKTWVAGSAHGKAWEAGDDQAPACTDCHNSHAIDDPVHAGPRLHMPDECGDCHGELYTSYRNSFHGNFTRLGLVTSATCSDCHTPHTNLPADDPRSSIHPDNLDETCGACHEGASAAFFQIDPHNDPTDPEDNAYVFYVYTFMMALLIGVFAFFGAHDLLWLQRTFVGTLRGEFREIPRYSTKGDYVKRFPGIYIVMHLVIIVTFLMLAITGLPLKFDTAPWAQTLMDILGGVESAQIIHRIAAIGTFGYMLFHLIHLGIRVVLKHERGLFWGPESMVPQGRDMKDLWANVRYFLYLGPHPKEDRWTYWEKFDYLAVFWGVMIIGLSGLMLWFPAFFTQFLPGWTINAALVIHSDEALLATGFIFVFHFFHTHLRPESFPMDPVVFLGRMPLDKFKEERPKEYQRMVEKGTLERNLRHPPTREELMWVYFVGFMALTIGLALAVFIFWALLTH
ncbi:hypothetical protein [Lentisalinibacter salinarum]|uniref:hypothetical protein n=1 Tax=Lentisalinibacter salinarum TaxID=2992239 RepID=UPI0038702709